MEVFSKQNEFDFSNLLEKAQQDGVFVLIDKSKNWTSFDVVAKIRGLTKIKKIGHAGTLDPLATGLLIVALGRSATKQIDSFRELAKTYIAEIKLGATTITDDAEGQEQYIMSFEDITQDLIENTISKFTGKIEQLPPIFSAQKIDGQPAYKSARKNKEVTLRTKSVEIYSIEIKNISLPFISVEVNCSKGTYIRSLARDIGESLGCGGYLFNLRRTKIGDYSVEDALSIDEIIHLADGRRQTEIIEIV